MESAYTGSIIAPIPGNALRGATLTSSVVESKINRNSPDFEKNTRRMVDLLTEIKNQEEADSARAADRKPSNAQHKKGRLTARERIAKLIDPQTPFFELGIYAAYEMYEEWGGAPAAGDSHRTRARLRAAGDDHRQRRHGESRRVLPDDGEESDPRAEYRHRESHSHDLSGRFRRRFSAPAGRCLSRYRRFWPRLSQQRRDERHGHSADHRHHGHVRGGRRLSAGDVRSHSDDRGLAACSWPARRWCRRPSARKCPPRNWAARRCTRRSAARWISASRTTNACLARIRALVDKMGHPPARALRPQASRSRPLYPAEEIYGIFSSDPARQYDMREIIARIVDGSQFEEYRAEYGQTLLCGYARIGGWAVGHRGQSKEACPDDRRRDRAKSAWNSAA